AHAVIQGLGGAADRCVQAGAVAAGRQDTNTNCHMITSRLPRRARFARRVPARLYSIRVRHRAGLVNPVWTKWEGRTAVQKYEKNRKKLLTKPCRMAIIDKR